MRGCVFSSSSSSQVQQHRGGRVRVHDRARGHRGGHDPFSYHHGDRDALLLFFDFVWVKIYSNLHSEKGYRGIENSTIKFLYMLILVPYLCGGGDHGLHRVLLQHNKATYT